MLNNIMTLTDGYKPTHAPMYPPELAYMYSYNESRGGDYPATMFFGLQYLLKRHMVGHVVTPSKISDATQLYDPYYGRHGVFDPTRWNHIYLKHHGLLPLRISAVPEGGEYEVHTPLYTIENTCPECVWLVTYIDSLLMHTWYPSTVGTISQAGRTVIRNALVKSGDPALLPWKLHDFGFRGASSAESAAIGGAAHLVNFRGTDTVVAMELIQEYYHGYEVADSIPASEHSTIMAWGKLREFDAYEHILKAYPTGFVACVSDTYNLKKAIEDGWGGMPRQAMVLQRDGTLVVRPDSGDPPTVVLDSIVRLASRFGTTTNEKGYRVLDPHVRVIQGDGIDVPMIATILDKIMSVGYSADNVAFGMGGALLQKMNRDTQQFATKPSWGQYKNTLEGFPMRKTPVGDMSKWSQAGQFTDGLHVVYESGFMLKEWTWKEVLANAK